MESNLEKLKMQIKDKLAICGISSDEVALAKNLVSGKNLDKNYFICEGLWATEKLIQKEIPVELFLCSTDALERLNDAKELEKIAKMVDFAKKSVSISSKACQKISDRDGYDEFFAVCEQPSYTLNDFEKMFGGNTEALGIVLDGLEQPGNIGAILRSFDAAGGNFAIITNKKAKLTSSRLTRASLGASFMLPCLETDIDSAQAFLQKLNFKCVLTDLSASKSYKDADYNGRIVIVAGNEHTGISASWRELKNIERVIIPMLGSVESLNVGFASTLVAYEAGLYKNAKK